MESVKYKHTMTALVCTKHGLPEDLEIKKIVIAEPNSTEVLIKVACCSVNFPDTLIIQNKYQFKPELPFSPGSEVAGIIEKVGENVKDLKAGDRVLSLCGWGGMAEYLTVDASKVFRIPSSLDFKSAASLMYTFGTSYHCLKDRLKLKPGETLLILGAAGGIGIAAIQLGKVMGATVIAAASSDEKLELCKSYGADHLINYERQDLRESLKAITSNQGVDVILDPVGDKYTQPALRSIAYGGRLGVVGFAAGEIPKIPLNLALLKNCSIIGVFWGAFTSKEYDLHVQNTSELMQLFEENKISVAVQKIYTLEKAASAIRDMMDRKILGKAIVICDNTLYKSPIKLAQTSPNILTYADKEEILERINKSLGTSPWFLIDQKRVEDFADATLDHQWIHIDHKRAAEGPFGGTIVHGFLTLSLCVHLLEKAYHINSKMGINYGLDKVRFIQPLKVGSRIKIETRLMEAVEQGKGLKMKIEASFYSEKDNKLICVAELLSIVYF
jgi:NADPH:quinone reductase